MIAAKLMEAKKSGVNVIVGNKGFENNHECFSAFPYLDATGKERFGPEFEESEWCDCYALESSAMKDTIDAQPDVMAVLSKRSVNVVLLVWFHR